MKFNWIPFSPYIGKLAKFALPKEIVLPIFQTKIKGKKWIVGSGNLEFLLGSWEYDKRILFEKTITPSSVVYDIGAHAGFYTLLASELVGMGGSVISFEPVPQNLHYLKKHIELNRCQNVTIIDAAVSDKEGFLNFILGPTSTTGHVTGENQNDSPLINIKSPSKNELEIIKSRNANQITVKTVRIDDLVGIQRLPKPDFIKMDIEGAEVLALRGAKSTLERFHPSIFLSTHGETEQKFCIEFLSSLNYQVEPLIAGNSFLSDELFARVY